MAELCAPRDRTVPSDAFGAVAMVDLLQTLWNYSSVALVHSTDAYGAGGGDAFAESAGSAGLAILTRQRFAKDATDFSRHQRELQRGDKVLTLTKAIKWSRYCADARWIARA